jgi:triacylglycerol lipase
MNVILVHGIFDTSRVFWLMKRRFLRQGYKVFAPNLRPATGSASLVELAEQLKLYIEKNVPGNESFHLLGFSMGGLISRHYLQEMADLKRILSLTILSAPNNGSKLAWSLPLKGFMDMRKGSKFLKDLEQKESCLSPLEPLSIWTPFDAIILPPSSSIWRIARNEKVWVLVHPLMLISKEVFKMVEEYIQSRSNKNTSHSKNS